MAALDTLLEQLTHEDYYDRSTAARALGKHDDPRAREALLQALHDKDSWVVEYALESLGQIGHAEDAQAITPLLDHSHYKIRIAAATALGHIGTPEALPALEAHVNDPDSWVRNTVNEAIATIERSGQAESPTPQATRTSAVPDSTPHPAIGDPVSLVSDAAQVAGADIRDLTDGTVLLRLGLESGRAQKVRIITGEHTSNGEGRIRLLTILGPATAKTIRWSMKQNLRISRGAIGLLKLRGRDFLSLTEVVLQRDASVKTLTDAIERLAARGDRLEAMLSHEDQW